MYTGWLFFLSEDFKTFKFSKNNLIDLDNTSFRE